LRRCGRWSSRWQVAKFAAFPSADRLKVAVGRSSGVQNVCFPVNACQNRQRAELFSSRISLRDASNSVHPYMLYRGAPNWPPGCVRVTVPDAHPGGEQGVLEEVRRSSIEQRNACCWLNTAKADTSDILTLTIKSIASSSYEFFSRYRDQRLEIIANRRVNTGLLLMTSRCATPPFGCRTLDRSNGTIRFQVKIPLKKKGGTDYVW
jgi:hypothetical protein